MNPRHLLLTGVLAVAVAVLVVACPASNAPQPIPPSPTAGSGYQPPDQPPPPPRVVDAGAVVATPPPPPSPQPDGAACLAATDCTSGVCEGLGCGTEPPGSCAPARRACTKDKRAYCGCDGMTFYGSGSCPGRRYAAKSACPNG